MDLKKHTVKSYDNDLKSISNTLNEIVGLSLCSIDMIVEVFDSLQIDAVEKIQNHDYKINKLDSLIEQKVVTMLALRQPMAFDLRFVISALRVSRNVEKVGDRVKSTIRKIIPSGDEMISDEIKKLILEMVKICREMIVSSSNSFVNSEVYDPILIHKTYEKLDHIYHNKVLSFIDKKGTGNNKGISFIAKILFICKNIERIAEYAVEISEINHYVITGERFEYEN
jgi:phosphate transport system protein